MLLAGPDPTCQKDTAAGRQQTSTDQHCPARTGLCRSAAGAGSSAVAGVVVAARAPLPCPLAAPCSPLTSSLYPRAPSLHAGACLAAVLATSAVSAGAARQLASAAPGARVRPGMQRTSVAVWPSRGKHGRGLRRDLNWHRDTEGTSGHCVVTWAGILTRRWAMQNSSFNISIKMQCSRFLDL